LTLIERTFYDAAWTRTENEISGLSTLRITHAIVNARSREFDRVSEQRSRGYANYDRFRAQTAAKSSSRTKWTSIIVIRRRSPSVSLPEMAAST
jgi:hypothetical protein